MGDDIEITIRGDETVRVIVNTNVKMSRGKMAAQAIHAALLAYGIPHGRVLVLGGRPGDIENMTTVIHDAGLTEVAPGAVTAGCELEVPGE